MVRGSGSCCAAVRPGPLVFGIRISWIIIRRMVSLTDYHRIVMDAARGLPVEKRDIFLQRIAAMLALRDCGRVHRHRCCRRGATGARRSRAEDRRCGVSAVQGRSLSWTLCGHPNKANTASGAPSNKLLRYLFIGGRTRTRTLDPLIKSQLLSPND